jgi:hypothetical protein
MPNAECQMPNAECRMPNAECRMPNAKAAPLNKQAMTLFCGDDKLPLPAGCAGTDDGTNKKDRKQCKTHTET